MKVLALDHGAARTGLAVSDPTGTIVRPLGSIRRVDSPAGRRELDAVVTREDPERIVVGEPLLMSGERGTQAKRAGAFARRIGVRYDRPVHLVDERLTSVEAGRRSRELGMRADSDSVAACLILEAYLHGAMQ